MLITLKEGSPASDNKEGSRIDFDSLRRVLRKSSIVLQIKIREMAWQG
jgi:hypothetical protein